MPRILVGSGGRVLSVLTSSTAAGPGRPGSGGRRSSGEVRVRPVRFSCPPPGHGPVRALLSLSLSRDPHRGLGFTGSPGFVHVSSRGPGP